MKSSSNVTEVWEGLCNLSKSCRALTQSCDVLKDRSSVTHKMVTTHSSFKRNIPNECLSYWNHCQTVGASRIWNTFWLIFWLTSTIDVAKVLYLVEGGEKQQQRKIQIPWENKSQYLVYFKLLDGGRKIFGDACLSCPLFCKKKKKEYYVCFIWILSCRNGHSLVQVNSRYRSYRNWDTICSFLCSLIMKPNWFI